MITTLMKHIPLCLAMVLCSVPVMAEDQVVFEDTMNTINNWSKGELVTHDEDVDHTPYLKMGNGITVAPLPYQLTTDWTLEADMRHTNFSRGLWIGLVDKDMKQGYAALWDSSLEKYFDGKGMFVICHITGKDDKPIGFHSNIKRLGKHKKSPHLVKDTKFAHIKLSWEAASGKLTLSVDGEELYAINDTDFKTFDRIVMRGNTHGLLDNVKITTPKK